MMTPCENDHSINFASKHQCNLAKNGGGIASAYSRQVSNIFKFFKTKGVLIERGHLLEGAKSGIYGTFELDFQVRY